MVVCEEVEELLESLGMNSSHLLRISHNFQRLRQSETDELIKIAPVIQFETIQQLVQTRRRWVARLLRCLLRLGGIEMDAEIEWDDFLWILLRFCSLTQEELAQALFMIVCTEQKTRACHYVTKEQMEEFFMFYDNCQVESFDSAYIDFNSLPLSRYYVTDFCEFTLRFRQLLNPLIHLQQCLQLHLPGRDFWDFCTSSELFTRKITLEFFTMKRVRVHIRGDPPFRDTCDFLAPDALGHEATNQDQWYMRVRGIKQITVWGEQLTPEAAQARKEAEERLRAKLEKERLEKEALLKEAIKAGLVPIGTTDLNKALGRKDPDAKKAVPKAQTGKKGKGKGVDDGQLVPEVEAFKYNPADLSVKAAHLDEESLPPTNALPPVWMRACTAVVAPAPQKYGLDPPLSDIPPKEAGLEEEEAFLRGFIHEEEDEDDVV